MVRRLLTSHRAVGLSLAVLAVFFLIHYSLGRDPAKSVFDALVVGSYATIIVTWFGPAMRAIRGGFRDGGANITVSQWLNALLLFGYFTLVQVHYWLGRPEWLRDWPLWGAFSAGLFLSAAYAILAPINTDQKIEPASMTRWLIAVGIGCFVSGCLLTAFFFQALRIG